MQIATGDNKNCSETCPEFIVPKWVDKVDSGIGLSYRPASLCSLAGRCDNPMSESTLSPQSGTMNLATSCDTEIVPNIFLQYRIRVGHHGEN
jgi:hypothetical protein